MNYPDPSPLLFRYSKYFKAPYFLYPLIVACIATHVITLILVPRVVTHWNDSFWYLSQANFFLGGQYHCELPIRPASNSDAFSTYMSPGYGFVIAIFVRLFGDSWQSALAVFQHLCIIGAKCLVLRNALTVTSHNFFIVITIRIVAVCFCFLPITIILPSTIMSESVALAAFALFSLLIWQSLYVSGSGWLIFLLTLCTTTLLFARGEKMITGVAICFFGVVLSRTNTISWRRVRAACLAVAASLTAWAAITMAFNYQQHGSARLSTGTGRHLYNKFIGDLRLHEGANDTFPCLSVGQLPKYWWENGAYSAALKCGQSEILADDILKKVVVTFLPRIRISQILDGIFLPLKFTIQKLATDSFLTSELTHWTCCLSPLSILEKVVYREVTYQDISIPGLGRFTYFASVMLYYGLYVAVALMFIALFFGKSDRLLLLLGLLCIVSTASKLFLDTIVTRHLIEVWYAVVFWATAWIASPTRTDIHNSD